MARDGLNPRQSAFVMEYIKDFNATRSYTAAGYSAKSETIAGSEGFKLLKIPKIKAAIDEQLEARSVRTRITADNVLKRYWDIATADAGEIASVVVRCCRHCYGENNRYQYVNEDEYIAAEIKCGSNDIKKSLIHLDFGGYGYDGKKKPNEECTKCWGEGIKELHINPTEKLSNEARLIYDGIKDGKFGIEVKIKDQMKALEMVAKHIGMFTDKLELTGKDGNNLKIMFDSSLKDDDDVDD